MTIDNQEKATTAEILTPDDGLRHLTRDEYVSIWVDWFHREKPNSTAHSVYDHLTKHWDAVWTKQNRGYVWD